MSDESYAGFFSKNEFVEGTDFYYNEQGYKVFTEAYHLKRGYCCENGCLHCPYNFKRKLRHPKNKGKK